MRKKKKLLGKGKAQEKPRAGAPRLRRFPLDPTTDPRARDWATAGRRSPSGFSPRALSRGVAPLGRPTIGLPPPPYAWCRGLRSSSIAGNKQTTRYSTACLPFLLLVTEHPTLRWLLGFLNGALTSIFFLQKLSGIYMCRPMSFYWIHACCQDLTEFGLAMVGFFR